MSRSEREQAIPRGASVVRYTRVALLLGVIAVSLAVASTLHLSGARR
jgi:hypothetical protein